MVLIRYLQFLKELLKQNHGYTQTYHNKELGIYQTGDCVHHIHTGKTLQQVQRQIPNREDEIHKDVVGATLCCVVKLISGGQNIDLVEIQQFSVQQNVPEIDAVSGCNYNIVIGV